MITDTHPLFELHRDYARRVALSIVVRAHVDPPYDAAIQDALVGLFKATLRFDPHHRSDVAGVPAAQFTTFAFPFIAGAVRNGLRERRPQSIELLRELAAQEGEDLWLAGVDADAADARAAATEMIGGLGIVRFAAYRGDGLVATDPSNVAQRQELVDRVASETRKLPRRQRLVLRLLFGRSLGVTAIAHLLKVDKSQIARDFQKAIATLRFVLCPDLAQEKPKRLSPRRDATRYDEATR